MCVCAMEKVVQWRGKRGVRRVWGGSLQCDWITSLRFVLWYMIQLKRHILKKAYKNRHRHLPCGIEHVRHSLEYGVRVQSEFSCDMDVWHWPPKVCIHPLQRSSNDRCWVILCLFYFSDYNNQFKIIVTFLISDFMKASICNFFSAHFIIYKYLIIVVW